MGLLLEGGMCTPKLTPLDRRTASIIGTSTVYGIVSEKEDNIDLAESTEEPGKAPFVYLLLRGYVNKFEHILRRQTNMLCLFSSSTVGRW